MVLAGRSQRIPSVRACTIIIPIFALLYRTLLRGRKVMCGARAQARKMIQKCALYKRAQYTAQYGRYLAHLLPFVGRDQAKKYAVRIQSKT